MSESQTPTGSDADASEASRERVRKGLVALSNDDLGGAHYEFVNATVGVDDDE